MSVIYLVRHGQASFGSDDYDVLSELGRRQAELVGAELRARGVRVDFAVTGTLRRQRDTASAALAVLADLEAKAGLPPRPAPVQPELDSRWNEYDQDLLIDQHADLANPPVPAGFAPPPRLTESGGAMSSRVFQGLLDVALADWMARTDQTGPGSWTAFSGAVGDALDGLARRLTSGSTAVVFTSGGPIAAACSRLLGLGVDGTVALNRVMINGGITKIVCGRGGTNLVSINEHGHLEAAGREFLTYR
ncbi:MAG: histidine phosphatase family protein [Frankia sp.]|nr:histidine phosphatase family protein [Frankia sp.]